MMLTFWFVNWNKSVSKGLLYTVFVIFSYVSDHAGSGGL